MRDVIVIGNGPFGAAATKYLAADGFDVVCIGAAPTTAVDGPATVFSSHNDAARLVRYQSRDARWTEASRRALAALPEIERESGVSFYDPVGAIMCSAPGGDGINPDPRDNLELTGIDHDFYDVGDRSWRERWPDLDLPGTHWVAYEPAPAGIIRPLELVRAQNVVARSRGATIIEDIAVDVQRSGDTFETYTASGEVHASRRVLVAAGGFTNLHQLLPRSAPLELKTEVIVLGEVTDGDAERLAKLPTVNHLVHDAAIEGIYMTPAAEYPDGRHYIKLGANTKYDTRFRPGEVDLAWMQRWFVSDTDPEYLPIFQHHLERLWPHVEFVSFHTRPCLITYTDDGMPAIDRVDDGIYVAAGGNGAGAKSSDSWGRQAAELIASAAR